MNEIAMNGWIGVDLDGTLAVYNSGDGVASIGEPVPVMLARVKYWLEQGQEVRIFTARVAATDIVNPGSGTLDGPSFALVQRTMIEAWCEKHLGERLVVTATKDFNMIALYDDRCVQVEANTGRVAIGVWQ